MMNVSLRAEPRVGAYGYRAGHGLRGVGVAHRSLDQRAPSHRDSPPEAIEKIDPAKLRRSDHLSGLIHEYGSPPELGRWSLGTHKPITRTEWARYIQGVPYKPPCR